MRTSALLFTGLVLTSNFLMAGCSFLRDDTRILDGSHTDHYTHLDSFGMPFPSSSTRSLHFDETPYVLSLEVDYRELPVDSISALTLLEVPADVDVEKWIRYRNADFGNEYMDVEAEEHAFKSGSARLVDVRVKEEMHTYREEEIETQRVYYQLEAKNLAFEGNVDVPSLQTQEHSCFVGDVLGSMRQAA